VPWATHEKIKAMLRDNRAEYEKLKTRGVPREGAALLHGIAWCGECGHKMVVRYVRGSEYVCTYLQKQHGAPVCQRLQAACIDDRVAAAFLDAVAPAEMRDGEACNTGPAALDPVLRAQALALGERLPALWADPGVSREHRKALLRCLIDKVALRRTARDAASVRVVWRGGEVSEFTVALTVNALAALPRAAEMEARVLELARDGLHDDEIVRVLTAEGHRSPWRTEEFLPGTVQRIRLQHQVKVVRRSRWRDMPGWMAVTEAAARLQVPRQWVRGRIRSGVIRTLCEPSGRYLIPDTPAALDAIQDLQAGRVGRIDLTPRLNENKEH